MSLKDLVHLILVCAVGVILTAVTNHFGLRADRLVIFIWTFVGIYVGWFAHERFVP